MDKNKSAGSNGNSEKVVFRASSGDYEITESAQKRREPQPKRPAPAQNRPSAAGKVPAGRPPVKRSDVPGGADAARVKAAPPSGNGGGSNRPRRPGQGPAQPVKRRKKRVWPWIAAPAALILAAGILFVFVLNQYVEATYNYYKNPDEIVATLTPHSYTVSTIDEAVFYLAHPSLNEGDTIVVNDNLAVDIDEFFGGFLSLGLVNFDCSAGSLSFSGGTVIMASGREEAINMNGVSFSDTALFIDASGVDLTWGEVTADATINAKTLNGSPSVVENLVIPAPGGKMTIPVTLSNLTSSEQNEVEIQFISPNFLFVSDTVTVSLPAGGSETVDVDVVVLEGGRARIFAVGKSGGEKVIDGHSDYIELLGGGFYSGDPHTHTEASYTERNGSTLEDNVRYAYEKGHSFIVSVENDMFAEKMSQQQVDGITGESGNFLQLTALETGERNQLRHLMLYNYGSDVIPRSDYEVTYLRNYTVQDAIWTALEEDPESIIYIPHPFGYGLDINESVSNISSLSGITGMELIDQTAFSDWSEFQVTINVWNNLNIFNRQRIFGIGASNQLFSEYVGSRYTKGYMPRLSEDNIYKMLREGNMFASNGPELRFTLNDTAMGKDVYAGVGDTMTAKVYASSETPLTSVQVIRYDVDGSWTDLNPDYVLDVEFSEDDETYLYEAVIPVEVPTNVDDRSGAEVVQNSIYRLEVRSESSPYYEDIGMAFGNPIWVSSTEDGLGGGAALSSTELQYAESPPAKLFGMDIDLGFLRGLANSRIESKYGETLGGAQLFSSDNGYYYTKGQFTVSALQALPAEGNAAKINYHRYNSSALADKVTVVTTAPGRTDEDVKTIYLL